MTTYRTSDGRDVDISTMAFPYLCSALAKLERGESGPGREEEIAAMTAEKAERERVFGLMVADLKAEGFSVREEGPSQFVLAGPLGSVLLKTMKSEDAVWWALLKERGLVS